MTGHETPSGGSEASDALGLDMREPTGSESDPCAVVLAREEASQRLAQLTERERVYLALQGLGYTYVEMAQATSASLRTVERQVLRGRRKLAANGSH